MAGTPNDPQGPSLDTSRFIVDFVHRLLSRPGDAQAALDDLLGELSTALAAAPTGLSSSAEEAAQLDRVIRRCQLAAAGHIVRRLAHDFGNILTGILGFSELALSQQLAPSSPLHAYLTEIHAGAQNGAQFTSQLRLFARRPTATQKSCTVARALTEEEKRLRSLLPASVELRRDIPDDLPAATIDADALRQLLSIVLDNAREALDGGGVIEVSACLSHLSDQQAGELFGEVRPGTHVDIRVADNGAGLTEEARQWLFVDPFFSSKSRKRGFGLATAFGILSAHQGGLELLPRPEGGTITRLVLPAAGEIGTASIQESTERQAGLVPQAAAEATAPRERILVVDDDPMILQLVSSTLERAGFCVRAVAGAEEALRVYKEAANEPFCLVLSDILMPGMNGIDLARRLRMDDPAVRILFLSGQVDADFLEEAFEERPVELLAKPFRPENLVRAVRTAIDAPCRVTACR